MPYSQQQMMNKLQSHRNNYHKMTANGGSSSSINPQMLIEEI